LKKLDDHQLESFLRNGNKDVLVYLYEKNYKTAKAYVIKHGGSEGDVDGVLKDAIELLWNHFQVQVPEMKGSMADLVTFFINEAWQKGEAKRYISRNTRIKHYYLRMYNRKTAGVLVLLFIFISVPLGWIYIENFFSAQNNITANFADSLKQEEKFNIKEGPIREYTRKHTQTDTEKSTADTASVPADSLVAEKNMNEEMANNNPSEKESNPEKNNSEENLVVKKDKLLFTKIISIKEKSKYNSSTTSSSRELLEKLNPEAHLPEDPKTARNIAVEFWKSPVNYRGYKLNRNKIILFGIEDADLVKLYNIDENMYLEFGNDFFLLESNQDFKPLIRLRDPYILAQLNKP
jgi:hypothetical protein